VHGFLVDHIRDVCRRADEAGFVGLATYGEDPASITTMRLFYDAWSYFLDHPRNTLDDYVSDSLTAWFDSPSDARTFLDIALRLERQGTTRASLPQALEEARAARVQAQEPKGQATWDEFVEFLAERLREMEAQDRVIGDPDEVAQAMAEGFRIEQESSTTLVLPRQEADTLALLVRVDYNMENGLLPVMRLMLNDTVLGPEHAIDRPESIRTPHHDGYDSLAAFEAQPEAWRVKYDTDFEIDEVAGRKYDTLDYDPLFRFDVDGLWQEDTNTLRIENLERRFRGSDRGVLVVGHIELR
jgi:hypothetical protein